MFELFVVVVIAVMLIGVAIFASYCIENAKKGKALGHRLVVQEINNIIYSSGKAIGQMQLMTISIKNYRIVENEIAELIKRYEQQHGKIVATVEEFRV